MNDTQVGPLLQSAMQAQRAGRSQEAEALLQRVLAIAPEQPIALNSLGMMALAAEQPGKAADFFARAAAADPGAAELHMNVATARRAMQDDDGERVALEAALATDQLHFMALIRLAELHERRGEHVDAIKRWSAVRALAEQASPMTPELTAVIERAVRYLRERRGRLESALDEGLAGDRAVIPAADRRRFDACIDQVLGRRTRFYANECEGLYFPFLPADEFFDRRLFPWMEALEAETPVIRAEVEAWIASGGEGIEPYVAMDPGTPDNKWSKLDNSLAWGALHLWRHGIRNDAACAHAPRTAEIIGRLPLAHMPGRTPTVFFSLLRPHTHLPAHSGTSNTRCTVHLPLIVPPDCRFRVGGETRIWKEGEAFAFDDTIEHEAWNDSDQLRAVLIFDMWNPHLTEEEKRLLTAFFDISDRGGEAVPAMHGS